MYSPGWTEAGIPIFPRVSAGELFLHCQCRGPCTGPGAWTSSSLAPSGAPCGVTRPGPLYLWAGDSDEVRHVSWEHQIFNSPAQSTSSPVDSPGSHDPGNTSPGAVVTDRKLFTQLTNSLLQFLSYSAQLVPHRLTELHILESKRRIISSLFSPTIHQSSIITPHPPSHSRILKRNCATN